MEATVTTKISKGAPVWGVKIKLLVVLVIALLSAYLLVPAWEKSYAVIHTVLETFCITIAVSSFFVIWYVSKIRATNLVLGFGFLAVATLDVFHAFFWQGIGLFPGVYYDLSARYWVIGRFSEALFLILSTTAIGKISFNRYLGLSCTIIFSFSIGLGLYYSPQLFPVLLTPEGVTPIKIVMEYLIISMFILFLLRVYKGVFQEDIITKDYLILAILIAIPAELCFTLFTTITNFYNVLGHILKISYYYFFLRAVFAGFVEFPYRMLQLSEERFEKAFQYSPALKSIMSVRDGRFIDVNDMWLQTTGYSKEEVIGKTAQDLKLFPHELMEQHLKQILSFGSMTSNQRYIFQTKQGVLRDGLFSTQRIVLLDEPCVLTVTLDITEQTRHEKELLRLDRLNLIGQMAASLGHEVRNPLTTVRGFVQLLSEKRECQLYKEFFHIMIEELDRTNTIITQFLSLARDKQPDFAVQNLHKIINDLYPLLQADALSTGKDVRLEMLPVHNVKIDRNGIHQLIINLVRNGLEAMDQGGKITIRTFIDRNDSVLAIEDEGSGIDQAILDKIGTPFFTTKDQGTGLGLATCYNIAERNNARIEFNSNSAGTTFFVRFRETA